MNYGNDNNEYSHGIIDSCINEFCSDSLEELTLSSNHNAKLPANLWKKTIQKSRQFKYKN